MTIEEFRKQAKEWLDPLGYSIHMSSGDGKMLGFGNHENIGQNYPYIRCNYYAENKITVFLSGDVPRLFITIQSPEISFKHPDIKRYIDSIKHYSDICERFPAF